MLESDRADGFGFTESGGGLSVSRYDLVLAVIPTAFVVAILLARLLAIPAQTALVGASIIGAIALVDGMFRNPPRPSPETGTRSQPGRHGQ